MPAELGAPQKGGDQMKATKTKPVTKELKERFEDEALPLMQDMFAQAYHLTRNRADAEDLVQEAYIRGMRKFEQFEPGTNLKAWLGRILFNQFINEYRRKKRRIKSVFVEGVENMAGVEVIYPDKAPFIEKVQPMLEEYKTEKAVYDLIQKIKNVK